MRLFIAINFSNKIRDNLCNVIEELKAQSIQGRMTKIENLHLTLVFLGEIEPSRIISIKDAMKSINMSKFILTLSDFGYFRKSNGNIYWIGVKDNSTLINIYNHLCKNLIKKGFAVEQREYKPHITLSRNTLLKETFNKESFIKNIPTMDMVVDKISLMKSEQINGNLKYTEVYSVNLLN